MSFFGDKFPWQDIYPQMNSNSMICRVEKKLILNKSRVHVTQGMIAIIFCNGKFIGAFGEGTHILRSDNTALRAIWANMLYGAEYGTVPTTIFYVNTKIFKQINGELKTPLVIKDSSYGVPVRIVPKYKLTLRANRDNVERLVYDFLCEGNELSPEDAFNRLEADIQNEIRDYLFKQLTDLSKTTSLYGETDSHMKEYSAALKQEINAITKNYGFYMESFVLSVEFINAKEVYDKVTETKIKNLCTLLSATNTKEVIDSVGRINYILDRYFNRDTGSNHNFVKTDIESLIREINKEEK